jgi:hypothetical protein
MLKKLTIVVFTLITLSLSTICTAAISPSITTSNELYQKILTAMPGDTLTLAPGTFAIKRLIIYKSIKIKGAGPGKTILIPTSKNNQGCFYIASLAPTPTSPAPPKHKLTVTIQDLTIQGFTGINDEEVNDPPVSASAIFIDKKQTLTLSNCNIKNNTYTSPDWESIFYGGTINNFGTININQCNISNNKNTCGNGGGINNKGTMGIKNSTISYNTARAISTAEEKIDGSAIFNFGTLTLEDTTISYNGTKVNKIHRNATSAVYNNGSITATGCTFNNNYAATTGTVIANAGAMDFINCTITNNNYASNCLGNITQDSPLTLINCTISQNGNSRESNLQYVLSNSGTLNIMNTIVSDNLFSEQEFFNNSTVADFGYNLINGLPNDKTQKGTIKFPIKLLPLSNNGGPTQTMALPPNCPAIGAGATKSTLTVNGKSLTLKAPITDQRGVARNQNAIDIGAYQNSASQKL